MAKADPERDRDALELRKAGATPEQIAETLRFADAAEATASFQRSLAVQAHESPTEAHRLELERLDAMQRALWPGAIQGKRPAIDGCLAIMERRARLLGLDGKREESGDDRIDQLAEQRSKRRAGVAKAPRSSRS